MKTKTIKIERGFQGAKLATHLIVEIDDEGARQPLFERPQFYVNDVGVAREDFDSVIRMLSVGTPL